VVKKDDDGATFLVSASTSPGSTRTMAADGWSRSPPGDRSGRPARHSSR